MAKTDIRHQLEFLNKGIIPLKYSKDDFDPSLGVHVMHDIDRVLADLDPLTARRLKRKFRKEWRKLAFRSFSLASRGNIPAIQTRFGVTLNQGGGIVPTRKQKNNRKIAVLVEINRKIIKENQR